MKYFIYFLLDPRRPGSYIFDNIILKFEPFYVGVSCRHERLNEHFSLKKNHKNKFKDNIIKKLKALNFTKEQVWYIFKKNLTKEQAFKLEEEIIKKIGRRNLKKGPLTNLDFGGVGGNGEHWKNRKHSEETKQKIRETIGDSRKKELNSNFGIKWTEEQKKQASLTQKENHKHLIGDNNVSKKPEVRKKLSETKMGLKNPNASLWKLISPCGEEFLIEGGIKNNIKTYGVEYQTFKRNSNEEIRRNLKGWILIKLS